MSTPGWKEGIGRHVAWFNKTTGKSFYEKRDCVEQTFAVSMRRSSEALEDHKESIEKDDKFEVLADNETVVRQLDRRYEINRDVTREMAVKVWEITGGGNIRFLWIPRDLNKAGKMLGS